MKDTSIALLAAVLVAMVGVIAGLAIGLSLAQNHPQAIVDSGTSSLTVASSPSGTNYNPQPAGTVVANTLNPQQ